MRLRRREVSHGQKKQAPNIDFAALQGRLQRQFRKLDPKDPSVWPALPKALLSVAADRWRWPLLWFVGSEGLRGRAGRRARPSKPCANRLLKEKLVKAVSLDELKKQREQVQQYVIQLEQQLPSKAEMAALLSDINQAGLGRSLQFELFRPGAGGGQGLLRRAADRHQGDGKLPRHGCICRRRGQPAPHRHLEQSAHRTGQQGHGMAPCAMEATARTYRYLDPNEMPGTARRGQGSEEMKGLADPVVRLLSWLCCAGCWPATTEERAA